MNGVRKTVAAAAIAGSMLVGGVAGAVMYGVTTIGAAAATTAANTALTAAREAQENAGIRPTVP